MSDANGTSRGPDRRRYLRPVVTALLILIATSVATWLAVSSYGALKMDIRKGRVERTELEDFSANNAAAHTTIVNDVQALDAKTTQRLDAIDDRQQEMYMILIDDVPKPAAQRATQRRQAARKAAQP